jgi:hypothetical protein
MDMKVIHSVKYNYRLKLVRRLLALIETNSRPTVKDINLYDALIMLKNSWDEVNSQCIKNCFIKSGFKFSDSDLELIEDENICDISIWDELNNRLELDDMNFEDYVNFDNDMAISDESFIQNLSDSDSRDAEQSSDTLQFSEDEELSQEIEEPLKLNDAINAIS